MNYSTVTATKFDFNLSILVLVFVVLGGLGNIWGSIIAAALLTLLPELLRALNFNDYRMLVYAILLIALMLFNNSGIKQGKTAGAPCTAQSGSGGKEKGGGLSGFAGSDGSGDFFGGLRAVDE